MGTNLGSVPLEEYTYVASEAIAEGRACKYGTASRGADLCDSNGEESIGIALHDAAAGEAVTIRRQGRFERAVSGAALGTLHTPLAVNTEGKYVAATNPNVVVGYCLSTTGGADEHFVIQLDASAKIEPA